MLTRMAPSARFAPGQIVHHRLFDYRGVVFEVDAEFSGTDEWYREVAKSRPPRESPWYHVLPDGETHTTYVAERNLEPADDLDPIRHPLVERLFDGPPDRGTYSPRAAAN